MQCTIDEAKLFKVVISEWMAHGYGCCTTRDMASIAGVNKAMLFRRFWR
ncbi:hypothetical protein [Microbulbifer sp. JMSA008]